MRLNIIPILRHRTPRAAAFRQEFPEFLRIRSVAGKTTGYADDGDGHDFVIARVGCGAVGGDHGRGDTVWVAGEDYRYGTIRGLSVGEVYGAESLGMNEWTGYLRYVQVRGSRWRSIKSGI